MRPLPTSLRRFVIYARPSCMLILRASARETDMAKFAIICERQITERQTLEFEAETLADAFQMAALAYSQGRTSDPTSQEYDWDDCSIDVTELDFSALSDDSKIICSLTFEEAEEATTEMLAEDYGVEIAAHA
jgi:hypothetical protein